RSGSRSAARLASFGEAGRGTFGFVWETGSGRIVGASETSPPGVPGRPRGPARNFDSADFFVDRPLTHCTMSACHQTLLMSAGRSCRSHRLRGLFVKISDIEISQSARDIGHT